MHTIKIGEHEIKFEMKRRRRTRSINVRVHHDGAVIVTRPYWVTNKDTLAFVERHAEWIIQTRQEANIAHPDIKEYSREHYVQHKERARKSIVKKINSWNKHYEFTFRRVSVRQARTRWGSCSSKGNLNFNYKLIFLPEELQDYVVVHELCHLKELNHGPNFWRLVAQTIPNHKELRKQLKNEKF